MAATLTLKEKFMVLALENQSGELVHNTTAFWIGLTGAVIFEMVETGILRMTERHLYLVEDKKTADKAFNMVISQLQTYEKPPRIKNLINNLWLDAEKLESYIIKSLIEKGILTEQKKKILWIFTVKRYPTINPNPELQLRKQLTQLVLDNKVPDEESYVLFRLINQCELITEVFGKELKKQVTEYIQQMKEQNDVSGEISQSVKEMELALFSAISSSTLAVVVSGN